MGDLARRRAFRRRGLRVYVSKHLWGDLGKKRRLYARLGVRELYLYDPEHQVQPSFRGFHLVEGELRELPHPVRGTYYSPLLGTELRVGGEWLWIIDPATGEPFLLPEDICTARLCCT
jgi:hypothetical protein